MSDFQYIDPSGVNRLNKRVTVKMPLKAFDYDILNSPDLIAQSGMQVNRDVITPSGYLTLAQS